MENTYALLVPCYNASKYIERFIKNIEKQIKPFNDIIFYDDASTDNTVDVISDLGYKVISGKTNRGPSFSRNILLAHTDCNWVHFHDPDDYLHEEYLLKTSSISSSMAYEIILCNVDWLLNGKLERSFNYSNSKLNSNPLAYTLVNPIGGINGLYLKEKLLEINGFDENLRIWEDADLHVRLAWAKSRFFVLEETLSFSIRRTNSASANQKDGWLARLHSLRKYSTFKNTLNFLNLVGIELEKTASNLIIYNDIQSAKEAMLLSVKCGNEIPSSQIFFWKILKKIFHQKVIIWIRINQLKTAFNKV